MKKIEDAFKVISIYVSAVGGQPLVQDFGQHFQWDHTFDIRILFTLIWFIVD